MHEIIDAANRMAAPVAQAILNGWLQSSALIAVAMLLLFALRRISAATRYAVSWTALLGTLILLAIHIQPERGAEAPSAPQVVTERPVLLTGDVTVPVVDTPMPVSASPVESRTSPFQPYRATIGLWTNLALAFWLSWSAWQLLRLGAGYVLLLRRRWTAVPAPPELTARLARWMRECQVTRGVQVAQSADIETPMLIGLGRPLILFPSALLKLLTADELDQILLHELAHVQRWDDWATLLQRLCLAFCGPHPLALLLSRRIDLEREIACDETVVTLTGAVKQYALCLTRLSELSAHSRATLAPAVAESRSQLGQRIERLLRSARRASPAASRPVLMALGLGLAILILQGRHLPELIAFAQERERQEPPAPPAPPESPRVMATPAPPAPPAPPDVSRPVAAPPAPAAPEPTPPTPRFAPIAPTAPEARAALEAGEAPQAPVAPVPPEAPEPPAPHSRTSMHWSESRDSLSREIHITGEVHFSDDDRDLKSLSNDGTFRMEEDSGGVSRRYEVRPDGHGGLSRVYSVNGVNRPLDADGQAWLGRLLPTIIRETGIDAVARVRRILQQHGPAGMRTEIGLMSSDGAKRRYLAEWASASSSNPSDLRDIAHFARAIGSDGEKRLLLSTITPVYFKAGMRELLFDSADTIGSDGEKRLVLSKFLQADPQNIETLRRTAQSAAGISSDGEKARLLIEIADHYQADEGLRVLYFRTVDKIGSDGERARVLMKILERDSGSRETVLSTLRSVKRIGSDGEKTRVLLRLSPAQLSDEPTQRALFDAADTIGSDGEHARLLTGLLSQQPSQPIVLRTIESAKRIGSDGEKSRVLIMAANGRGQNQQVREAIQQALSTVHSDGEYRRVTNALR